MKALTMWQPHASLLATGIRTIETRGWSTTYRGPLVIHAARKWDLNRAADWQRACSFAGAFVIAGDARHALLDLAAEKTLGCALGVVDLVDCRPIPEPCGTEADRFFGGFGEGRYGFFLENPRPFEKPVPYVGRQGLWELSEGIPW